jgi:hypothetical protein
MGTLNVAAFTNAARVSIAVVQSAASRDTNNIASQD